MSERKEQRYNQWAGNPRGDLEDKTRCIKEVQDSSGWHFYQCQRKRGYGPDGLYCKQHAKKFDSLRRTKTEGL